MEYTYIHPNDEEIKELIKLSMDWVEEDCSYGMVTNTKDDIKEPILVCKDNNLIIGYIFGHEYIEDKKRSCIELGAKCFMIDELYVKKEYRSQGIGKNLFQMFYNDILCKYDYYTLSTSTKDYKKILHFYIDELDMEFHSAFLFKKNKKEGK